MTISIFCLWLINLLMVAVRLEGHANFSKQFKCWGLFTHFCFMKVLYMLYAGTLDNIILLIHSILRWLSLYTSLWFIGLGLCTFFYLSVIKIFNARICHYYLHLCCYFHLHLPFVTMFCILAIIIMSTYHHYMMDLTFVSVFLQVLQLRKCNGSIYIPVKGFWW